MVKLFLILAILNNACLGDSSSYPIQGIDVSRHQKHIVWGKVSAAKVKFAYIKATEGTDWVDPLFKKNYQAARTNGLVVGGYHFFSFCSDPGLQAKHFIKHLRITRGDLIPAVDVEIWGNCKEVPSKDELRAKLKVFMNWVEKELGCRPIIYTDQIFFLRYFYGAPSQELFWILNPLFEPFVGKAKKVLWQHSVSPLNGIDGDVDKNVFLGSPAEFENIRYKPLS